MNIFTPNFYSLKKVSIFIIALFAMTNISFAQNPTSGGSIAADQSICPGETPLTITSTAPATGGGTGTIEYLWMYSTTGTGTPGGAGYNIIAGSNSLDYSPGPLGVTTYFVRCARRVGSGNTLFTAETNVVTITVLNSPTATINPSSIYGFTGLNVDFIAGFAGGATYSWDLNDDGFFESTGLSPNFTYTNSGTYTVTLIVDNGSCTATTTVTVTIIDPIIISISDPCANCGDGANYILGAPDQGYYIHDYIQIVGNPGETWTLTNTAGLFDNAGNPLPAGTVIPETTPGTYYLNVWFNASAGGWSTNATNGSANLSAGPGAFTTCTTPCPSSPLPVELISFEGNVVKADVELKWVTASELNNSHFEIERSFDGQRFDKLTVVEGAGTTADLQTYKFMDESALIGINYYRLKQVDLNGDYEYADVITVKVETENPVISVLPNPVKDVARVRIEMPSVEAVDLQLLDTNGKLVKTIKITNVGGIQEVNMEDVPAGIYFLSPQNTTGIYYKLIKL